jgi:cation transporter-like permease
MAMMPIIIPMGDIIGVVFLVIAVQIHYGPF